MNRITKILVIIFLSFAISAHADWREKENLIMDRIQEKLQKGEDVSEEEKALMEIEGVKVIKTGIPFTSTLEGIQEENLKSLRETLKKLIEKLSGGNDAKETGISE